MGRKGARARVRVGCSGWVYPHWRGPFYPPDLPEDAWFAHYARAFDTVEINSSFYGLPTPRTVAAWKAQAPPGFVYAVKANRFITHMKKLRQPRRPLRLFIGRMRGLGEHLGPVLYQLPPNWRCDPGRLEAFLRCLPAEGTHVFEFRHPSWLTDEVLSLLDRHGASLCVHDLLDMPRLAVGRVAYVRFHGTQPWYAGGYGASALRSWARWLGAEAAAGRGGFAYFNNDAGGQAVVDARRLARLVR